MITFKKLCCIGITCIGCSVSLVSVAFADWAAIAYNRNTGASGKSWKYYSAKSARNAALDACNENRCVAEMVFEDYCGALARKRNNISIIFAGWSVNSLREAGNNALAKCGEKCELVTSVCSNIDN